MSLPILLVGGVGRMESMYRAAAKSLGYDLEYAERKLPTTPPQVARVVVVASVCSHPLREAAERVAAAQGVSIFYLRTASLSALRKALVGEVRCDARRMRTLRDLNPALLQGRAPRRRGGVLAGLRAALAFVGKLIAIRGLS